MIYDTVELRGGGGFGLPVEGEDFVLDYRLLHLEIGPGGIERAVAVAVQNVRAERPENA